MTLENWQDAGFNRWGFQHVRDLVPTARIESGPRASAWRLPRADRDLGALRFKHIRRSLTINSMLDETWTDGFLVLHRGAVMLEHYGNGMDPGTPHVLMSVSKSIVAAMAGILFARGSVTPETAVTALLPELAGSSFDGATLRHLLDMRAGIRFDEDYTNIHADVRAFEQIYQMRPRTDPRLPPDACAYFATLGNDGPHGGPFRYRSVLIDVLGWALERVAGARLAELLSREVWRPMGAEFDADIVVDGRGNAMADGGMSATLRDLGRFGLLFEPDTRRGRRAVVPVEWVRDTVRGASDGAAAMLAGGGIEWLGPQAHYRNAWWVREPTTPFFQASGIHGQAVFIHGPSRVVIAKLSSYPEPTDPRARALTLSGVRAIVEAVTAAARSPGRGSR